MNYNEKIGKAQRSIMLARRALADDPRFKGVQARLVEACAELDEVEHYIEALVRRLSMHEDEGRERE